jgi:5-formyltetrahydrofolate cyclo-ligase
VTDIRKVKQSLRTIMRGLRAEAAAKNPAAAINLSAHFIAGLVPKPQAIISGYIQRETEINPEPLMRMLCDKGYGLSLPVILGREDALIFRRYSIGDILAAGAMPDIPEPLTDKPILHPDILIVPLLAFDGRGYRLGYGGGYYDRTINDMRRERDVIAVGLAYACQQIDEVPRGAYDVKLDAVVTETSLMRF